jgi:MFS family permease
MSIFPYAYRMIESFDIANNENQTSMYAGMLITAFAFAEFSTGMLWGRVSDRIGRKPVLIMGLFGTAISMITFGFSKSLPTAIISRALGGLLNGNVGVLQTTVAELVTKKEHQPRAYSIMPFVWCLGSIIGPAMGGALAMPCEAYPWLFSKGTLFDSYPFLLPNLVSVVVLIFGITTGILFLEETHAEKKYRRDVGLEMGDVLVEKVFKITKVRQYTPIETDLVSDSVTIVASTDDSESDLEIGLSEKATPVTTFNRQVILIIVGYGILA